MFLLVVLLIDMVLPTAVTAFFFSSQEGKFKNKAIVPQCKHIKIETNSGSVIIASICVGYL